MASKQKLQLFCTKLVVVMGGDTCSKVLEFESLHHILDGHFSHLFVVEIE